VKNIIFVIFRRLRLPLILLVITYNIAVLGMVLIPGQDADGNPWHMGFFHAFYFVGFMSTTIGFGEIPYEFTDAQRLWVMFTIYSTVVAWIYSIGTLITLLQGPAFRHALVEVRFARRIRRLREPFYLICGYGETGSALVESLTERHQHAVVVEIKEDRVSLLRMENLHEYVPALCGDAGRPAHLLEAGLEHPLCDGVVALTNFNEVNLKIAITAKLLHHDIKVICRADSHDVEENMASFGTDYIIDPFDTFGLHLAIALQSPGLYLLQEWLTGMHDAALSEPVYPPREGLWVVCGYGRFGKAIYQRLIDDGIETIVVEAMPEKTGTPEAGIVVGRGTEARTLREAHIERAVGLVAGTDDDTNNLSIVMTARDLNPDLFVVVRQNLRDNQSIIDAVQADVVMHPSHIVANKIRMLLETSLMNEFMFLAKFQGDDWACELISRILALVSEEVPEVWERVIDADQAYAVCRAQAKGEVVTVGHLLSDPREREYPLPCIALLLMRDRARTLLPKPGMAVKKGDRLLFCGRRSAKGRMEWVLENEYSLGYVIHGEAPPQGLVWRMIQSWRRRNERAGS
jgi:Trk K+ transport system NAD-binding subunit